MNATWGSLEPATQRSIRQVRESEEPFGDCYCNWVPMDVPLDSSIYRDEQRWTICDYHTAFDDGASEVRAEDLSAG